MEFKDYYLTLGVERSATADEIKKAFRKLARKYHPDVSKEPNAEARMKELNEAFAVLSDAEKRAAYDNVGEGFQPGQEFRPPPGWDRDFELPQGGFSSAQAADFSDFFAELFGAQMGRAGASGRSHFRSRGEDHHAKIMLDLEDAYRGATRTITLRVPQAGAQGRMTLGERSLEVRIPKGVHEGQLIRLAGQGNPGLGGGESGDLLLEVRFKPHARYRADGRDVYAALPVAPWEAALGGAIEAPLPDGKVAINIPAGSQTGRKLRLKGRGIPGAIAGDLYLVLEVVLPPASDPKARALYEAMQKEVNFNPRANMGG